MLGFRSLARWLQHPVAPPPAPLFDIYERGGDLLLTGVTIDVVADLLDLPLEKAEFLATRDGEVGTFIFTAVRQFEAAGA